MRLHGSLPEPDHLARVLRLRRHVAEQYLELLRRYHGDGKGAQRNPLNLAASPPS
jgi:hypothetical protein